MLCCAVLCCAVLCCAVLCSDSSCSSSVVGSTLAPYHSSAHCPARFAVPFIVQEVGGEQQLPAEPERPGTQRGRRPAAPAAASPAGAAAAAAAGAAARQPAAPAAAGPAAAAAPAAPTAAGPAAVPARRTTRSSKPMQQPDHAPECRMTRSMRSQLQAAAPPPPRQVCTLQVRVPRLPLPAAACLPVNESIRAYLRHPAHAASFRPQFSLCFPSACRRQQQRSGSPPRPLRLPHHRRCGRARTRAPTARSLAQWSGCSSRGPG